MLLGVDQLIDFLLEKVALHGAQGATATQICKLTENFYAQSSNSAQSHVDPLPPPTVDERLHKKVWTWLLEHPDLHCKQVTKDLPAQAGTSSSTNETVVFTSPDRMWQAIAGHGVDNGKIRDLEFELLSIIAAHGEQGILQTDLLHLSGQDKRSLPHRTDILQTKGYINKQAVQVAKKRTSLLTLQKFYKPVSTKEVVEAIVNGEVLDFSIFENGGFKSEYFLDITLALLKKKNGMSIKDFCSHLGFQVGSKGGKQRYKNILRYLYRLDTLGCIKRQKDYARQIYADQTISYLKEPNAEERYTFTRFLTVDSNNTVITAHNSKDYPIDDFAQDEDVLDVNGELDTKENQIEPRLPHWNPDYLLPNQTYNLVATAGPKGLSTMQITEKLVGRLYRRPIDHLMGTLTETWHLTPPKYLRHLALIRDTGLYHKYSHYVYRSYDNFAQAVKAGDTSWEAINVMSPEKTLEIPQDMLDGMGFPKLPTRAFADGSGWLTPAQCRAIVGKKMGRKRGRPPGVKGSKNAAASSPKSIVAASSPVLNVDNQKFKRGQKRKAINAGLSEHIGNESTNVHHEGSVPAHRISTDGKAVRTTTLSTKTRQTANDEPSSQTAKRKFEISEADVGRVSKRLRFPDDCKIPPGIYRIDPETSGVKKRGRPRKSIILIAHSKKLLEMEWFCNNGITSLDGLKMPSAIRTSLFTTYSRNVQPETEDRGVQDGTDMEKEREDQPPEFAEQSEDGNNIVERASPIPSNTIYGTENNTKTIDSPHLADLVPPQVQPLLSVQDSPDQPVLRNRTDAVTNRVVADSTHSPDNSARNAMHESPSINLEPQAQSELPSSENIFTNEARDQNLRPQLHTSGYNQFPRYDSMITANTERPISPTNELAIPVDHSDASQVTRSFKTPEAEDVIVSSPPTEASKGLRSRTRLTARLGKGAVGYKRNEIIFAIFKKCGGIFPGDNELWPAYFNESRKVDPNNKTDHATVIRAVKNLVTSAKLRKLTFSFKSQSGIICTKHILTEPHIRPDSDAVKALQKKMVESHPLPYLPPEIEIEQKPTRKAVSEKSRVERKRPRSNIPAWRQWVEHGNGKNFGLDTRFNESDDDESEIPREQAALQSSFGVINYRHEKLANMNNMFDRKMQVFRIGAERFKHLSNKRPNFGMSAKSVAWQQHRDGQGNQPILNPSNFRHHLRALLPRSFQQTQFPVNFPRSHGLNSEFDQTAPALPAIEYPYISFATRDITTRGNFSSHLLNPTQAWYPNIGIFSTSFGNNRVPIKRMRPKLSIQPNLARDFDENMPNCLQDILWHASLEHDFLQEHDGISRINYELQKVQEWEKQHREELTSDKQLPQLRFINHEFVPGLVKGLVDSTPIPSSGQLQRPVRSGKTKQKAKEIRSETPLQEPMPVIVQRIDEDFAHIDAQISNKKAGDLVQLNMKQTNKFVVIALIGRSLLGGTEKALTAPFIARLTGLKDFMVKGLWAKINKLHGKAIEQYQTAFEEAYLQVCEAGILPIIDYDHKNQYDWARIIHWTKSTLNISLDTDMHSLPLNRKTLEDSWIIAEDASTEPSRREFYHPASTNVRRHELLGELPFHHFFETKSAKGLSSPMIAVKSRIRANSLAEGTSYNAQDAKAKLAVCEPYLERALEEMQNVKLLRPENKGRIVPGRNFYLTDIFHSNFTKAGSELANMFQGALQHKFELDQNFEAKGFAVHEYFADDKDMMIVLNLIAMGFVNVQLQIPPVSTDANEVLHSKLSPSAQKKLSIWGFTRGNYKTAQMDRENLMFPMHLTPTSLYTHGILTRNPQVDPPPFKVNTLDPMAEFPLWYDINGNFLPEMWQHVTKVIISMSVLRPFMDARNISELLRGSTSERDIQVAGVWLQKTGLIDAQWRATELWWCAFAYGIGTTDRRVERRSS